MRCRPHLARLMTTLLAAVSATASAGGLYIYDVNPADTVTPRAAWLNPAAMTAQPKPSFQAMAGVVVPIMKFDPDTSTGAGSDGGNAGQTTVLPDLAYVRPLGGNWWAGFSAVGLFGGGLDYGDNFVGRYAVTEVELQGVGLVPSLAYKVNDRFSIGAGVSITRSKLDQKIAFNNLGALPDGRVHFDNLDDWGAQPFAGITFKASEQLLFGLVYRAEMDLDLDGKAKFSGIAPVISPVSEFSRDITVEWTNAQTIEAGIQYHIDQRNVLHLTGSWEDWSVFKDNILTLDTNIATNPAALQRNWKDTWSVGGQFVHIGDHGSYSFGINYNSSPVSDRNRTFDLPYDKSLKLKLGYIFAPHGKWTGALGTTVILGGDAEVDQTVLAGTLRESRVTGEFDTNVIVVVGGTLHYAFD